MLDDHPPFNRIISDQANATDRQWLRMLSDAFEDATPAKLMDSGISQQMTVEILGIVALNDRIDNEAAYPGEPK